jgi:hypothetical protein
MWDIEEGDHCDNYIDDKDSPIVLRRFLRYHRWPATYECLANSIGVKRPQLFATFEGTRVKVVMASRMGDVGITTNLAAVDGYQLRVLVKHLSNFSSEA